MIDSGSGDFGSAPWPLTPIDLGSGARAGVLYKYLLFKYTVH